MSGSSGGRIAEWRRGSSLWQLRKEERGCPFRCSQLVVLAWFRVLPGLDPRMHGYERADGIFGSIAKLATEGMCQSPSMGGVKCACSPGKHLFKAEQTPFAPARATSAFLLLRPLPCPPPHNCRCRLPSRRVCSCCRCSRLIASTHSHSGVPDQFPIRDQGHSPTIFRVSCPSPADQKLSIFRVYSKSRSSC